MTKLKFLMSLHGRLSELPEDEVEERLNFYSEMIEDRIEEGLSEEEAVAEMGSVDEVAEQIIAEIPLSKIVKKKMKPKRRLTPAEITLLALGSPLWLSLLIVAFSLIISLFAALWSVIIAFWAVFASLIVCAFSACALGIGLAVFDTAATGIALTGTGLVCAGIGIFSFYGCRASTKGAAWLTRKIVIGIKKCFVKKEAV